MADFLVIPGRDYRNNVTETVYAVDNSIKLNQEYSIRDKFITTKKKYNVGAATEQIKLIDEELAKIKAKKEARVKEGEGKGLKIAEISKKVENVASSSKEKLACSSKVEEKSFGWSKPKERQGKREEVILIEEKTTFVPIKEEKPFGWTKGESSEDEDKIKDRLHKKKANRKKRKKEIPFGWSSEPQSLMSDKQVKDMLRRYNAPICLFGEDSQDRKERLQKILTNRNHFKTKMKQVFYQNFLQEGDSEVLAKKTEIMNEVLLMPKRIEGQCEICNVICFGKLQWESHLLSIRHQKKVAEKSLEDEKEIEGKCEICCVECNGEEEWQAHLNGEQHKTALQQASDEGYEIEEEAEDVLDFSVITAPQTSMFPPEDNNWSVVQVDPEDEILSHLEYPDFDPGDFSYPYEAAIAEFVWRTFGEDKPEYSESSEEEDEDDPYNQPDGCRKFNKRTGCYNCGSNEHMTKFCEKPRVPDEKRIGPCFTCSQMGHRENTCPKKRCYRCREPGHFKRLVMNMSNIDRNTLNIVILTIVCFFIFFAFESENLTEDDVAYNYSENAYVYKHGRYYSTMTNLKSTEYHTNGNAKKTENSKITEEAQYIISDTFAETISIFKELLKDELSSKKLEGYLPTDDNIVKLRALHQKRFLFKEEDYEILENAKLMLLRHKLHPLVDDVLQDTSTIMTWIKLMTPKAACGNNFGVEVQETAFKEVEKVQKLAHDFVRELDNFDHSKRTRLGTDYLKNPQLAYVNEIRDLDRKFFLLMRNNLAKLRDGLMVLKDFLNKNMDKITNPRGEERSAVYTS
uniref:CCHC-type domain-containing protein n=1 Tax=Acrobeloides nanus TaxID=290746 RepID=A0A914CBN8_9BILA